MPIGPSGATRFDRRRILVAAGLVAWASAILVSAGADASGSSWLRLPDLSGLLASAMLALALVGLIMIVVLRPAVPVALDPRPRRSARTLLLVALAVAALALVIGPRDLPEGAERDESPRPEVPGTAVDDGGGSDAGISAVELFAVALIAAAGGVVLRASRDRPESSASTEAERADAAPIAVPADVARAFEAAIEAMRASTDPRSAVMSAYAELERALAGVGRGRQRAETPTEHLARVLDATPVLAEPALLLGSLYERARFSGHPVTAGDHRDAVAALERARRHIVGAEATA